MIIINSLQADVILFLFALPIDQKKQSSLPKETIKPLRTVHSLRFIDQLSVFLNIWSSSPRQTLCPCPTAACSFPFKTSFTLSSIAGYFIVHHLLVILARAATCEIDVWECCVVRTTMIITPSESLQFGSSKEQYSRGGRTEICYILHISSWKVNVFKLSIINLFLEDQCKILFTSTKKVSSIQVGFRVQPVNLSLLSALQTFWLNVTSFSCWNSAEPAAPPTSQTLRPTHLNKAPTPTLQT